LRLFFRCQFGERAARHAVDPTGPGCPARWSGSPSPAGSGGPCRSAGQPPPAGSLPARTPAPAGAPRSCHQQPALPRDAPGPRGPGA
jgi:hypothetical protein